MIKPILCLLLVQFINGGNFFFAKLSYNVGMNISVLIAYRFLLAAMVVIPLAFFIDRGTRPPVTRGLLLQGSICGLFGGPLAQHLNARSLHFTSGANSMAISNMLPAFTFIMAFILRLEVFNIRTRAGYAKIGGTMLSVGGAMLVIFLRVVPISPNVGSLYYSDAEASHRSDFIGVLYASGSSLSLAVWVLLQAKLCQTYPKYSSLGMMTGSAAILSVIYALMRVRGSDSWKVHWGSRLLCIGYMGGLTSGVGAIVVVWCLKIKGAIFVSTFTPVGLLFVVLIGSLLFHESLYLSSILGGVLIITGVYIVLWGMQARLERTCQSLEFHASSADLHSGTEECDSNESGTEEGKQSESDIEQGGEILLGTEYGKVLCIGSN